jgi:hypothetical protein
MKRFLASLSCLLALSAFSLCQVSTSFATGPNGMHGTVHFSSPHYRGPVIAGAPYSAERVSEHVQTLADGTHINQTNQLLKIDRDSMGRTRVERPAFRGPIERRANWVESPIVVEINDPVAHVRYVFILEEAIAHRQALPADNSRAALPLRQRGNVPADGPTGVIAIAEDLDDTVPPAPPTIRAAAPLTGARQPVNNPEHLQITKEDLGTQTIEGVEAEGKRRTMTWPADAIGNDAPITNTSETWTSPALKEVIVRKSDDPRYGVHTFKLVNINRSEPDASLFEPPPGYTVKDEPGEFTINWAVPR